MSLQGKGICLMAEQTITVTLISPTTEDFDALRRDYENHLRRFGDPPAPHLLKAADDNLRRIADSFSQCFDRSISDGASDA